MLSAILFVSLVLAAPEKGIEEVWQGTLTTESVKIKGKKKKATPVRSSGDTLDLTIRIKRHGDKFTGEWIEGRRALDIAGDITNRRFEVTTKHVKRGDWKKTVVDDLRIVGQFDGKNSNTLNGQIFGKSIRTERSGAFSVTKKTAPTDTSDR